MNRLALVFALALSASAALASDDALIKARYLDQQQGINKMDSKRFFSTLDKSFVQIDQTGKRLGYVAYRKGLMPIFQQFEKGDIKLVPVKITYGNGVATAEYALDGALIAKGGKLLVTERGVDTWKKFGSTYLLVKEVVKVSHQHSTMRMTRPGMMAGQ